jgi:hypothetical protein
MKKNKTYYFRLATKLVCLFQGNGSRSRINIGLCWFWASLVKTMIPESIICKVKAEEGYHVFIKLNGLYFDSEHHTGKTDWKELRTYKRLLQVNPIYSEGYSKDQVLLKHYLVDSCLSDKCTVSDYMFIVAEHATEYSNEQISYMMLYLCDLIRELTYKFQKKMAERMGITE